MESTIGGRIRAAWNAFLNRDPTGLSTRNQGMSSSRPSHRKRLSGGNERSIVTSVYNQCSIDVAAIKIQHVRLDENENYIETISSGLNNCLTQEANIDQASKAFIQDVVMSMFDEGHVALVPIDTNIDPANTSSFDILTMRTGKVLEWFPRSVRVRVYNDRSGQHEEIIIDKTKVAIVENPLYAVMNEPNSTLHRLIKKLNILDAIDEQSGSGKLDLIVKLPYSLKSESRKNQAEARRKDLEDQLSNTKYGIGYIDATEQVTQLNRPVENNLMGQIEYLTRMLYSQLGLTETIFNGTADEQTLINYQNRTVLPIVSAICQELKRKFLSKTAITQGQTVMGFRDIFSLVSSERLADLADKLGRNEIATSNEFRGVLGWKPSKQKSANELRNKNLNEKVPTDQPDPNNQESKKPSKEKKL